MKIRKAGSPHWRRIKDWSQRNRDDVSFFSAKKLDLFSKDPQKLPNSNHLCCLILDLSFRVPAPQFFSSFIDL